MKTKKTAKHIFFSILVLGLFFSGFYLKPAFAATECGCYVNGSKVGNNISAETEAQCNQYCVNQTTTNPAITQYRYGDTGVLTGASLKNISGTPDGQNITGVATNICDCDGGSLSKEIMQKVFSLQECQQYCVSQGAARRNYNYTGYMVLGSANATQTTSTSINQSARFDYKLLESFPGFYAAGNVMTDLPGFILSLYKFGIWTVGIAGLFMLVVGGFMYMASAGNNSTASSAKSIIWDSLIGIVAALVAYLILYVINPDLTRISLNFTPVEVYDVGDIGGGNTVADKGNQSTSGGCIKPVNAARQRESWVYNQSLRGQTLNGITYTDCSNFVASSYAAAGCASPGSNTTTMYSHAKAWSNISSLKAGDAVVNYAGGHVVLCMDDGCTQVIEAPGTGKPISIKAGDYFTSKNGTWSNALVIKAADYCHGC